MAIRPEQTIADVLSISQQLAALERISQGSLDENDYVIVNNDWSVQTRAQEQL